MKNRIIFFLLLPLLIITSCNPFDFPFPNPNPGTTPDQKETNNVLLLKVDYTTTDFEGGKEFTFSKQTDDFTVITEYNSPGDFGDIKLFYSEINEMLFYGEIIWMGTGKILYPTDFIKAEDFDIVLTEDLRFPEAGFDNIFNPINTIFDYDEIWMSVQHLVKVRKYLESNPDQIVKIFLYTPSVGVGDPETWKWIILMKN